MKILEVEYQKIIFHTLKLTAVALTVAVYPSGDSGGGVGHRGYFPYLRPHVKPSIPSPQEARRASNGLKEPYLASEGTQRASFNLSSVQEALWGPGKA